MDIPSWMQMAKDTGEAVEALAVWDQSTSVSRGLYSASL